MLPSSLHCLLYFSYQENCNGKHPAWLRKCCQEKPWKFGWNCYKKQGSLKKAVMFCFSTRGALRKRYIATVQLRMTGVIQAKCLDF